MKDWIFFSLLAVAAAILGSSFNEHETTLRRVAYDHSSRQEIVETKFPDGHVVTQTVVIIVDTSTPVTPSKNNLYMADK